MSTAGYQLLPLSICNGFTCKNTVLASTTGSRQRCWQRLGAGRPARGQSPWSAGGPLEAVDSSGSFSHQGSLACRASRKQMAGVKKSWMLTRCAAQATANSLAAVLYWESFQASKYETPSSPGPMHVRTCTAGTHQGCQDLQGGGPAGYGLVTHSTAGRCRAEQMQSMPSAPCPSAAEGR